MDISKTKLPPLPPPPKWQCILLPFLAGILHLRVFYYALFHCILHSYFADTTSTSATTTTTTTNEEFLHKCFTLDFLIFTAYMFDLLCCKLRIVPFSRVRNPKDIFGHHMPTLVLALPLAIPLWGNYRSLELTSLSILDEIILDGGNSQLLRADLISGYTLASGFAYISSLNEVFMCFQRVEMSMQGVDNFRNVGQMKHRVFTSRGAVYVELCYKLCFFWGLSIVACKACCDFDWVLYQYISGNDGGSIWRTLLTLYSSPAALRGALFRAFSVVMYPSMGSRCLNKIKQHHEEGKRGKSA